MSIFQKAMRTNRELARYQGPMISQTLTDMEIARFDEVQDDVRVINHQIVQLGGGHVPQLEQIRYSQK